MRNYFKTKHFLFLGLALLVIISVFSLRPARVFATCPSSADDGTDGPTYPFHTVRVNMYSTDHALPWSVDSTNLNLFTGTSYNVETFGSNTFYGCSGDPVATGTIQATGGGAGSYRLILGLKNGTTYLYPSTYWTLSSGSSGSASIKSPDKYKVFTNGGTTGPWYFDGSINFTQGMSNVYLIAKIQYNDPTYGWMTVDVINSPTFSVSVPVPLSCSASVTPASGTVGSTVFNFTGSASGGSGTYSWNWTLGNAQTSVSQNPSITYTAAGTYSPLLTVTDSAGHTASCSTSSSITVNNPPPPPPSMSGTLTPASSTCTIASGASSCAQALTWTTTNPISTSLVTNDDSATPLSVSGNNSSATFTVPYHSSAVTFTLSNNSTSLATATVSTVCASGTSWDGVSNTCKTTTISYPDLTASTPSPNTNLPGSVIFTTTISNIGNASTNIGFTNLLQVSSSWDGSNPNNYTAVAPVLNPSATANVSFPSVNLTAGTYYVRACADLNGALVGTITESNESNNCSSGTPWTAVVINPVPIPVVTVSASPTSGTVGVVSPTITFSATNSPTACNATGDWISTPPLATSSSQSQAQGILNQTKTYSYSMSCTNAGGTSAIATATVTVNPVPVMSGTLSASPNPCTILNGQSSCNTVLSYSVSYPESSTSAITASGISDRTFSTTNTYNSGIDDESIPYNNGNGRTFYLYNNSKQLATVQVLGVCTSGTSWDTVSGTCKTSTISVVLSASPTSVILPSNNSTTLTWTTTGTPDSCTASNAWSGSKAATGGTQTISNLTAGTYTYVITCTKVGASNATSTAVVTVSSMSGTLTSTNCTIPAGQSSCNTSLAWSTTNPVGTSAVTTPVNITVGTGNSGSASYAVAGGSPSGSRTFYLYNNSVLLAQSSATATCASGTSWNGSICYGSPTPLPDLTASSVTPTSATVGISKTFSSTISNIGSQATETSFYNFFQVASASQGGGTIVDLPAALMPALVAGATNTASVSYTFSVLGTYSMRACADKSSSSNNGTIVESNEGNNCGSWADITVSPSASLYCALTASPSSGNSPLSVTLSAAGYNGRSPYSYKYNCTANDFTASPYVNPNPCKYTSSATAWAQVKDLLGNTAVCSTPVTVISITSVNGQCSSPAVHYTCATGTSTNNVSSPSKWSWTCAGSGTGKSVSCFEKKSPGYIEN